MRPTLIQRFAALGGTNTVDSAPSRITDQLAPVKPGAAQAFASQNRFVEQLSHESRGWLSDIIRSNLDPITIIEAAGALERVAKGLRPDPPLAWINQAITAASAWLSTNTHATNLHDLNRSVEMLKIHMAQRIGPISEAAYYGEDQYRLATRSAPTGRPPGPPARSEAEVQAWAERNFRPAQPHSTYNRPIPWKSRPSQIKDVIRQSVGLDKIDPLFFEEQLKPVHRSAPERAYQSAHVYQAPSNRVDRLKFSSPEAEAEYDLATRNQNAGVPGVLVNRVVSIG